jgi:hypothetical protein
MSLDARYPGFLSHKLGLNALKLTDFMRFSGFFTRMILRAGSPLLYHPEARRDPATFVSEPIFKAVSGHIAG